MVRLSQPWIMRYPLIDFHGSNGNQNGDGPAASRYTEARLSKIAEEGLLKGIKKKNVDFMPNYDETLKEPVTLPAIFPNLLCNPNTGIGVAMASSWLPHNLTEVSQAIFDYMDGKEPTLPGPDFPTGGIIINEKDISNILKTGHGSVKVRGKYNVEKNNIIFYEIPYNTTIEGILEEISKLCDEKEIEGISEIRDETNKKGLRIVIECNKQYNPDVIANQLFAKTNLQTSISYNQVALIDKTPTELNLKQAIEIYINHNIDCLLKEINFDLTKAKDRLHIIEGLLIALEDIDNVIALIKGSENSTKAKESLIEKYLLSEEQAKAILAMRLASLAKLEKLDLLNEKNELKEKIAEYESIINNKDYQIKKIKDRLTAFVHKFGDKRRTELTQIDIKPEEKEVQTVVPKDVVVITSQSGLIKKIPITNFRVQRKGGKGVKSNDDAILSSIKTNTVDYMMFFTNTGKMYRTIVDNIPDGTNISKGVPISSLVQLENTEKVIAVSSLHRQTIPQYAIFITKNGMIKKTYLEEYLKVKRNSGTIAIKLKEGDSVVSAIFQDEEEMVIITKQGMGIRFKTDTISPIGKNTMGVKGINLNEKDEVLIGLPVHKINDKIGIFTQNGMGKKIEIKDLVLQSRGGRGSKVAKVPVVGAAMMDDEDNILLLGAKNSICISAKEVPLVSKAAEGNILAKTNIISTTKI